MIGSLYMKMADEGPQIIIIGWGRSLQVKLMHFELQLTFVSEYGDFLSLSTYSDYCSNVLYCKPCKLLEYTDDMRSFLLLYA